ncbi:MAG: hypothetical protein QM786_02525 [Breznakibacter sp.]
MTHQFKLAFKNLKKSPFPTSLNLIGLSSAFAAFILIMVYVWNEYHFDHYNKHVNEIYRLEVKSPDEPKTSVFMLGPTGKTLVDEFPEIEAATIYMPWGKWGEETFVWEKDGEEVRSFEDYSYADKYITDVFTFDIVKGEKAQPLLKPQSAMVSEEFARKAWGDITPLGRQMKANGNIYTVTAVFAPLPENSVIKCPILLSFPTNGWIAEAAQGWDVLNYPQFIKVARGTDAQKLNERINSQSVVRSKYTFYQNGTASAEIVARPLRDLHFTDETAETPMYTANSRMFVGSLFWVGILILVIALINYVNFATAVIPRRAKSIGIARIIGSSRLSSVSVSVVETVLVFALAFVAAFGLAVLVNYCFAKSVLGYMLPFAQNIPLLGYFAVGILLVGVLTGLYPALYGTSGRPIDMLKQFKRNTKTHFRSVLTVSQFAATIALIAVSALVVKQLRFMETTNLGFRKDNTLVIRMNNELHKNYQAFENSVKAIPDVCAMGRSRAVPGQAQEMRTFNVNGQNCSIWYWAVDDGYIDMMGFQIVQGRNFLKDSQAETNNLICNETAAKKFGWELGTKVGDGVLVGIIKDFNFVSLREQVEPFAFWCAAPGSYFGCISIKLSDGDMPQTMVSIENAYRANNPSVPFRYYFLDDQLNLLYAKESLQVKLITSFSLLSVVVSVLGLLGLSTFMCQYRIKEIGIRKVNGARISEIMVMLNGNFVKWVAIAFVVAVPLSWLAMRHWLEGFVYKTPISWWIFALSGLSALAIALLTVSWQSWHAAVRNPVETLRHE